MKKNKLILFAIAILTAITCMFLFKYEDRPKPYELEFLIKQGILASESDLELKYRTNKLTDNILLFKVLSGSKSEILIEEQFLTSEKLLDISEQIDVTEKISAVLKCIDLNCDTSNQAVNYYSLMMPGSEASFFKMSNKDLWITFSRY